MIRTKRGLITAGLLTVLIGLTVTFPARVAYHLAAPPSVAVAGIEGTAWNGSAREASIGGLYLRDLRWEIRPLSLFTGELSYAVSAKPVSGFLDANISIGFSGVVMMSDLNAALSLDVLADAIGVNGLKGNASLTFERLELTDGVASAADGIVQIANLVVPIVDANSLGGYKAEFFTQNNGVTASVEDTDGVVDLAGSLQIKTDRSFEFIAQVVVKPQTSQNVRRQLSYLPPPNDRGQQELRLEGIL